MAFKKNKKDNVVDFSIFRRPALKEDVARQGIDAASFLTLRNIVIGLGLATFLIFLGSAVSARMAFLFAALLGLTGLVLFEMSSRRAWESKVLEQFDKMSADYERLVREVARGRNEMSGLKKSLSDAGTLARSYGRTPGEDAEQRMIKAIADQLSRLGEVAVQNAEDSTGDIADDMKMSPLVVGLAEKDNSLRAMPDDAIGRRLSDDQVLQIVNLAVKQDRIDLFLQPIVGLPQRKLRFYEMFSRIRIRKDTYLPAERYIEVAIEQDLAPTIDNLLLLRGLQMVRDTEEENFNRAFFCNITSLTLNDPKFMADLVEFISHNRTLAPRLVFELGQRDLATMSADVLPVLSGLASLGCRFSMDQVRSLSFDFAHLEARHVRFVKVEAALLLAELKEIGGLSRLKRLKSEFDRNGIDLIAEKIESDRDLLELLDAEIDYGQGYLFGKPSLYEGKVS